jgi:oligopeptide transport system permease protein
MAIRGAGACPTVSYFIALKGTRQKVRAMLKFILRRCLEAIPTLFILITISFFMMRLAPGSPFTGERTLPPEVMANIEANTI